MRGQMKLAPAERSSRKVAATSYGFPPRTSRLPAAQYSTKSRFPFPLTILLMARSPIIVAMRQTAIRQTAVTPCIGRKFEWTPCREADFTSGLVLSGTVIELSSLCLLLVDPAAIPGGTRLRARGLSRAIRAGKDNQAIRKAQLFWVQRTLTYGGVIRLRHFPAGRVVSRIVVESPLVRDETSSGGQYA